MYRLHSGVIVEGYMRFRIWTTFSVLVLLGKRHIASEVATHSQCGCLFKWIGALCEVGGRCLIKSPIRTG